MKGVEFKEVRDTITRVFNPQEFDYFLRDELDFDRRVMIANGSFRDVVDNVLSHFEQRGEDARLIAEVARIRPLRPDVQEIYQKYARALLSETRKQSISEQVVKAYEQYGLVPRVVLQTAGRAQLPTATSAASAGFEVEVHKHLPLLAVAVWRTSLFKNESRVCRIELNDGSSGMGSGFLVGPDVVLTNYHVMKSIIADPSRAPGVRCRFDHKELAIGSPSDGILVGLHATNWQIDYSSYSNAEKLDTPDAVAPTADELDYAVIRLERPIGNESLQAGATDSPKRGWIQLPNELPAVIPQMPILILQYPNRGPLKLAFDTDAKVRVIHEGRRIRYSTNTEGGSSGSPCFNLDWQLLALHHYGDPKSPFGGKEFNQGVPVDAIRKRLIRVRKADALGGVAP
ncbi:hypothetical protein BH10PLA2_BH10PLA2_27160 [soil metagenome]